MDAEARERVDAFHQRLVTPIGELPQDQAPATSGVVAISPFRVVGISVLLIGVMMLGILWWVWRTGDMLAFYLDVFLGGTLVVIGGLMARHSGPAKPQDSADSDAANEP
jgi:hypothetical protein